ncbi:N-formylglutamate deformylase [Roseateles koreensis]|uniref:N-formylglutamate deformylase n=1 Tax=Roseateles koreensis TaxID=2987526 RepID=A0ABT5KW46_9BURK|nr:N-formylglutamate deformylase [Roseateles koreensis]MDC8786655.1 N-formylglutamate deformylase [Roseateles koreensis]
MSEVFKLKPGRVPLLISMPHVGTEIPADQHRRYVPRALEVEDTDWHLEQLYADIADELGASLIVPRYSRYLIDLNRPPDDTPMYPGASNTELCPTRFFTGDSLYLEGQTPGQREKQRRRETYWLPYHKNLQAELSRLKAQHGYAVLFDAHSIRSELPWLFSGRLPDLNLGTADGAACDLGITKGLAAVLAVPTQFTHVVNGRFKGGYITRYYGQPERHQHAVQLEMCQRCYMDEWAPFNYRAELAAKVQPVLLALLQQLLAWRPAT